MKFKIGDKVKFVRLHPEAGAKQGLLLKEGFISDIINTFIDFPYIVEEITSNYSFSEEELELVLKCPDYFKKDV